MLEMILALMPRGGSAGPNESQIETLEIESAHTLSELLAVADDARIEGGRSGFDPDAVVEAVGTMRRIAHRLGSLAAGRNSQDMPALPPQLRNARDAIDFALRAQFEACLDFVKRRAGGGAALSAWNENAARAPLDDLHARIAADSFSAVSSWPLASRRILLAEIETYRRLAVLTGELSEQLQRIALPGRPVHQRQHQPRPASPAIAQT